MLDSSFMAILLSRDGVELDSATLSFSRMNIGMGCEIACSLYMAHLLWSERRKMIPLSENLGKTDYFRRAIVSLTIRLTVFGSAADCNFRSLACGVKYFESLRDNLLISPSTFDWGQSNLSRTRGVSSAFRYGIRAYPSRWCRGAGELQAPARRPYGGCLYVH